MLSEVKSHKRYAGLKQSKRAIEEGIAIKAFVAEDCADNIKNTIIELCNAHNISIEYVSTMKQLGNECELDVGCAVAVITS